MDMSLPFELNCHYTLFPGYVTIHLWRQLQKLRREEGEPIHETGRCISLSPPHLGSRHILLCFIL